MSTPRTLVVRLFAAGIAIVIAWLAWNALYPSGELRAITPRGELPAGEKATIDLFERAKGSVVYISTQQRVVDPRTRNVLSIPQGTGSGFVWDEHGHIVTNFHVVKRRV